MRSVRRLTSGMTSSAAPVKTGVSGASRESAFVERNEILLPDRQSAELAAAARRHNPSAVLRFPWNTWTIRWASIQNGWWIKLRRVRSCLSLRTTTVSCRLRSPKILYARAGEPKKLVILKGYGHYEVYVEPAFSEVMAATLDWYRHLSPSSLKRIGGNIHRNTASNFKQFVRMPVCWFLSHAVLASCRLSSAIVCWRMTNF